MDAQERQLQRDGYVQAFRHPEVIAALQHTDKHGHSKIRRKTELPPTGRRCVKVIVTDKAVFDVTPDGLVLREAYPGLSVDDIRALAFPVFRHRIITNFTAESEGINSENIIRRLIELIAQVLPEASEVDLYWGYHNLSGALTLTLGETGRLDRLSGGRARSGDLQTAGDYMVRFAAAGFRAVAGLSPSS